MRCWRGGLFYLNVPPTLLARLVFVKAVFLFRIITSDGGRPSSPVVTDSSIQNEDKELRLYARGKGILASLIFLDISILSSSKTEHGSIWIFIRICGA